MVDTLHVAEDRAAAIKTYRYLRIGMVIGIVVLGAAILRDWQNNGFDCFQTSISAYYFTPVRTIFAAVLFVISSGLITIKGKGLEDISLNFAGVLAPLVAVIPTSDVGSCWVETPVPYPVTVDGGFQPWVRDNIVNNVTALAVGAVFALLVALVVIVIEKVFPGPRVVRITRVDLAVYVGMVVGLGGLIAFFSWRWDNFLANAHGLSAMIMFMFLGVAIATNSYRDWNRQRKFAITYGLTVVVMALTAIVLKVFFAQWDHMVLWLEGLAIGYFALFWVMQTAQHWRDIGPEPEPGSPTTAVEPSPPGRLR